MKDFVKSLLVVWLKGDHVTEPGSRDAKIGINVCCFLKSNLARKQICLF